MNQNQENQSQNEKKVFQRNCENPKNNPDCHKIITYKAKYDFLVGLNSNSKCKACSRYKENNGLSSNQRLCPNSKNNPECENIIIFATSNGKSNADLKNLECRSCRKYELRDQTDLNINQRYCPNPEDNPRCRQIILHANSTRRKNAEIRKNLCASCAWVIRHRKYKKYELERLLSDELESFYWMGFLLADGGFSTNGGLGLEIAYKDYDHLLKFSKFVNCSNEINIRSFKSNSSDKILTACSIGFGDKFVVDKLLTKFNIIPPKTYNPPNIEIFNNFSEDQIKSLLIGFIDGDGCIYGGGPTGLPRLKIECHITWEPVLKFFMKFIGQTTKFRISSRNLAGIHNGSFLEMCDLKKFVNYYNLPVLSRKWDKIDFRYKSRQMKFDEKYFQFKELFESGESIQTISKIMMVKKLGNLIRRFKKENNYEHKQIISFRNYKRFIELFLLGKRNGEIAKELNISPGVISNYKKQFLNETNK